MGTMKDKRICFTGLISTGGNNSFPLGVWLEARLGGFDGDNYLYDTMRDPQGRKQA